MISIEACKKLMPGKSFVRGIVLARGTREEQL
jgi:hypothetical protein